MPLARARPKIGAAFLKDLLFFQQVGELAGGLQRRFCFAGWQLLKTGATFSEKDVFFQASG